MNRFRTKKKAKDDLAASRTSEDSEQSSFRGFLGRKKVQQEEVKKEFDLSTALPSTDDFRTSLLMSNLSARFSMLREQDDPNTKIGKASDDSVLYPKRQSRMAEFGFSNSAGLTDIAEVESIKAAAFLRKDSFASDETGGGSVMNRSKPTEGNNLFGGRQKIYKIPAGAKSLGGGMTGRALYDDDVAMSAFQRWRLAERERSRERESSAERGSTESDRPEDETEPARAPSPILSTYNRKRETTSTTSSASIMARNSTAATSIASQVTGSVKDAASSTTPTSATSSVLGSDRLVTRTRKLYEQGLTQDMQEQQSSALSKIDTLARQRPFGTRTPDLAANSPSSIVSAPLDRSISERRALLAKASAPNMRFASSSTASASTSPVDLVAKAPSQPEAKPTFGGVPPLSPPISETGEVPILPIQPNDIGKATALGMFQKPSQPYDESRFAERQILLKQGREAPAQSLRAESDAITHPLSSVATKARPQVGKAQSVGQEEGLPPTPVPDSELLVVNLAATLLTPELNIERPADEDHPAFRQSALPTPLSVNGKTGHQHPTILQEQSTVTINKPKDSPTLGVPSSGLSGMVRQHLRSESNASSIYEGGRPQTSGRDSRFNLGEFSPSLVEDLASRSNPWMNSGHEWAVSYYGNKETPKPTPQENPMVETKESDRPANVTEAETDEFASQLADARRRVREKLTSFVESDSSRSGSPRPPSASSKDFGTPASSTSLGLGILKTSSSRSSLVDRSRGAVGNQPKPIKMLGIGSATMSSSPQPSKESFDEKDLQPLETMKEETPREAEARVSSESANNDEDGNSTANPGLRAFRQARRELQKRRELETLARHQMSQTSQPKDQSLNQPFVAQPPPRADRNANNQRTPSRERKPPPVAYRQRAPSDEQRYHNSPGPSGERDRSGSESSRRSNSRPRVGTNMRPQDQLMPGARQPTMRSPGLPGTDIKGSPIMPPHPYPGRGVPSPAPSPHLNQSRSIGNLAVHTGRLGFDAHAGQPSPISPMGLPSPAPYASAQPGSPIGNGASFGSRPRQSSTSNSPALGPVNGGFYGQMKRMVDKRDISEPTFMSSTTRVPTMNLPQQRPSDMSDRGRSNPSSPSRSNSRGPAPPVPPINPRRMRQGHEEAGLVAPRLPYTNQANNSATSLDFEENRSAFSVSEDEAGGKPDRRRLRKAPPTDAQGLGTRGPGGKVSRENSPPYLAKGPLKNRTTINMGPGGMI